MLKSDIERHIREKLADRKFKLGDPTFKKGRRFLEYIMECQILFSSISVPEFWKERVPITVFTIAQRGDDVIHIIDIAYRKAFGTSSQKSLAVIGHVEFTHEEKQCLSGYGIKYEYVFTK